MSFLMLFLMMLYRSCAKKNVTSKIAVMKFVSRLANPETGWPPSSVFGIWGGFVGMMMIESLIFT
jgi:hypothetical protein